MPQWQSLSHTPAGSPHRGFACAGAAKKTADIEIVIKRIAAARRIALPFLVLVVHVDEPDQAMDAS
ncbi:MAG: hypothetical protein M3217_00530 [Actinomycetota bacterium]|nr:hypothetical protein [Actinomycetota bacterium]